MKFKHLFLAVCMFGSASVFAQDADKATITGNADAAQKAADDLQKVDLGEKAWKFDGVVGLNGAATGLVNWAAGGKNNVNAVAFSKLHLLYHKDNIAWETNFDTDFALTWIDQDEDPFQKSSDNIKLFTKFGWEFKENWYLTVLGGFQSQYAIGRDYIAGANPIISKWLAPSYTDISIGIDWKKSYNGADFSLYLSPVAGRIATAYVGEKWNQKYTKEAELGDLKYIVDNLEQGTPEYNVAKAAYDAAEILYDEGGYETAVAAGTDLRSTLQQKYGTYIYARKDMTYDGKDYNAGDQIFRNYRAEFGLSFKGGVSYKYENLTLGTTIQLFSPYQGKGFSLKDIYEEKGGVWEERDKNLNYFEYSNNNRFFGHFDVDWDFSISYQFLKVLNVSLATSLKYYNGTLIANKNGDLAERVQFKSVVGVGIGYSF